MVDSCYLTYGNAILKKNTNCIEEIDLLIFIQSHHDYAGNAARLKNVLGRKVIALRTEVKNSINGRSTPVNGIKLQSKIFMKLLGNRIFSFLNYQKCHQDIIIDDDYRLDKFGIEGTIIHIPGYTQGLISIIVDNQYIFIGDTLFGVSKNKVHPPFAMDKDERIESWERLLKTEGNYFLPGHFKRLGRSRVQTEFLKDKN